MHHAVGHNKLELNTEKERLMLFQNGFLTESFDFKQFKSRFFHKFDLRFGGLVGGSVFASR